MRLIWYINLMFKIILLNTYHMVVVILIKGSVIYNELLYYERFWTSLCDLQPWGQLVELSWSSLCSLALPAFGTSIRLSPSSYPDQTLADIALPYLKAYFRGTSLIHPRKISTKLVIPSLFTQPQTVNTQISNSRMK